MRISKLPASQQLVGTVTPAFDRPRTPALPLQIVCHLLGSGNQLHPTGLYQPALTLSHHTATSRSHSHAVCQAHPQQQRSNAVTQCCDTSLTAQHGYKHAHHNRDQNKKTRVQRDAVRGGLA